MKKEMIKTLQDSIKSKKNTNKTNEYIYSLEYDNIIVLPLKVVQNLVKMWDIIIKGIEEKLSFDEVYELSKEYPNLLEYCIEGLNNLEDDRLYIQKHNKNSKNKMEENRRFQFPGDYQVELSIFDENGLMELYLPMEILEGVSTSMGTGTGGSVIIIPIEKEQSLINICKSNGWKITRDDSLISEGFKKGYDLVNPPLKDSDKPLKRIVRKYKRTTTSNRIEDRQTQIDRLVANVQLDNPGLTKEEIIEMAEAFGF